MFTHAVKVFFSGLFRNGKCISILNGLEFSTQYILKNIPRRRCDSHLLHVEQLMVLPANIQDGGTGLQKKVVWQVLVVEPINLYPAAQEKETLVCTG